MTATSAEADPRPSRSAASRRPGAAASYPVHNPARPAEIVGYAPAADLDQLDAAVQAARRAAAGWRALDVAERVAAVASAATTAGAPARRQRWLRSCTPASTARCSPRRASKSTPRRRWPRSSASIAEQALAPERIDPPSAYPRLQREPYGVAALVLPFNWPLALTMTKLSSALAAGNTAVVKVPPTCPLAALQFGAAFAAALPPGVVNVLAGPGSELAQALITHPGIDVISLTGGVATGRAVMAAAAPRLTPVLLELGGNDPAIIAPDIAITDELVEQLFTATYTTCGQVCMAIKRLYAPADRVDELADAVLARCRREVVGDGLADEVTLGPMHTAAGRDRVVALVADAAARGATVRTAGVLREADADAGGYFVLPTVVTDLSDDAPLATEEQFGPVLPIFGYRISTTRSPRPTRATSGSPRRSGPVMTRWPTGSPPNWSPARSASTATAWPRRTRGCRSAASASPASAVNSGRTGIRAFTQPRAFVRQPAP